MSRARGGGRGGRSGGKRTDCLAGRCGADQFSPPAYQSCPLTLSFSADDTLSLPVGPFPGQEQEREKKKKGGGARCMFVRACRDAGGGGSLLRVVRAGFCQDFLSPRSPSEQTRGPSGELHAASSPASVPTEVAASKALSAHNALEASSS